MLSDQSDFCRQNVSQIEGLEELVGSRSYYHSPHDNQLHLVGLRLSEGKDLRLNSDNCHRHPSEVVCANAVLSDFCPRFLAGLGQISGLTEGFYDANLSIFIAAAV